MSIEIRPEPGDDGVLVKQVLSVPTLAGIQLGEGSVLGRVNLVNHTYEPPDLLKKVAQKKLSRSAKEVIDQAQIPLSSSQFEDLRYFADIEKSTYATSIAKG